VARPCSAGDCVMALCECGCGSETNISRRGAPRRFLLGHEGRRRWSKSTLKTYRYAPGRTRKTLHVVRAERALGKALPPGAEVHHADGSKSDTAPLVICQDRSYHALLHKLMRVRAAGGNPHKERVCSACRAVLPFASFYGDPLRRTSNAGDRCMECSRRSAQRSRDRRAS
jgi:hypothetical protein